MEGSVALEAAQPVTRALSLITANPNAPASQDSASPLLKILVDLRRKYATLAGTHIGYIGGTLGFATESADIWLADYSSIYPLAQGTENIMEESISAGADWDNNSGLLQYSSAAFYAQDKKQVSQNVGRSPSYSVLRESQDVALNLPMHQKSFHSRPGNDAGFSSSLMHMTHAEHLLFCAPHLRILSPASAQMQDCTQIASRNPLLLLFAKKRDTTGSGEASSSEEAYFFTKGNSNPHDYIASIGRNRFNLLVARELAAFVTTILAHELPLEEFASVEADVFSSIFALIHSTDHEKRLAGVAALYSFIGVGPSSDEERKAIKFASTLSNGLRAHGVTYEFLAGITDALGLMALGASNVDYVEFELTRALEWLRYERSDRRLAAVLTIKALAVNASAVFMSKINQEGTNALAADVFSPVIRDAQPIVRVCAADALTEFLKVVIDRKYRSATGLLCHFFSNAMDGFNRERAQKSGPIHLSNHITMMRDHASIHGSLLILHTLITVARDFMKSRFEETCEAVLELCDNSHALVRLEILRIIPKLAHLYPGPFSRRYVRDSLNIVIFNASAPPNNRSTIDLRRTAFLSLGDLVLSLRDQGGTGTSLCITSEREPFDGRSSIVYMTRDSDIHVKMATIVSILRSCFKGLPFRSSNYGTAITNTALPEALHCCAALVEALGNHSISFIDDILDDMFGSGLSEDLISCLHSIAISLPSKAVPIERRLLYELSKVLAGSVDIDRIFDPLHIFKEGVYQIGSVRCTNMLYSEITRANTDIDVSEHVVAKLLLTLRRLGSFGGLKIVTSAFPTGYLLPFVQTVLCPYLYHPSPRVRKETALTCCHLMTPIHYEMAGGNVSSLGYTSSFLFEEILQKLLRVALSDSSSLVRRSIIQALDQRYDFFICRINHLSQLFLLLRDESFPVRIYALRLIGRLAILNPAPVLAECRNLLMELIKELTCNSDSGGGRESAIRILIEFFKCCALHRLLHPYLRSIIDALPLKGVPPRLAITSLESLGELALVVRTGLNPWLNQLIPHTLEIMTDHSSTSKQQISLRTLGQLAGGTGYVISPYFDYPSILPLAASILPGTKRAPWTLRREVIRTLGILGALDPDRYHASAAGPRKGAGTGSGYFLEVFEEETDTSDKDKLSNQDGSPALILPSQINTRTIIEDDETEPAHLYMYEQYAMTALSTTKLAPARRLSPSDEDFYPTVTVQALTRILRDSSLAVHHAMVMQAVMYIFNSLGILCVPFLPRIIPHILHTIRSCGQTALREALLQQIASLSNIVREHLHPYSDVIFGIIDEFWGSRLLATVLSLVEKMAFVVPEDFRRFIPRLVPKYLAVIEAMELQNLTFRQGNIGSFNIELERLELILKSLRTLRVALIEYIHLLIPALLKLTSALIHSPNTLAIGTMTNLSVNTVQTISSLLQVKDASATRRWSGLGAGVAPDNLPARAAQPLLRLLTNEKNIPKQVCDAIIESICICAIQLGKAQWIPLYHSQARNAISACLIRTSVAPDSLPSQNDNYETNQKASISDDGRLQFNGLQLYDAVINELVSDFDGIPSVSGGLLKNYTTQSRAGISVHKETSTFPFTTESLVESDFEMRHTLSVLHPLPNASSSKHRVNPLNLSRHWDTTQRTSRDDWDDWMNRFAVQLLREAPAPSLRATAGLAYAYQPLARELFPAAFICCWPELSEQYRASLINALETAFSADISPEILQTLLNLAEFMEHDCEEGGLPIDISILGQLALKCRSYAKALHYKEREYNMRGGGSCIEDIISVNKKLDMPEAALGILKFAQVDLERRGLNTLEADANVDFTSRIISRHHGVGLAYSVMTSPDEISQRIGYYYNSWPGVEMRESWFVELGSWSDALAIYERKLGETPNNVEAILGCMRSLDARGEWRRVLDLAKKSWGALNCEEASVKEYRSVLKFCSQAAWRLKQWDDLEAYSRQLIGRQDTNPKTSSLMGVVGLDYDSAFYNIVLNIHKNDWQTAANYIESARQAMDARFTALMSESFKRAAPSMLRCQALAEMEEIIAYRKLEEYSMRANNAHFSSTQDILESRRHLLSVWKKRLAGCRFDIETHLQIQGVRSLILSPLEDVDTIMTLSALARQSNSYKLSERLLLGPLEDEGCNLNGALFGMDLPTHLSLGLTKYQMEKVPLSIDLLLSGEGHLFFPVYDTNHEKFSQAFVKEAGGFDRVLSLHKLYFSYLKHLWSIDERENALYRLGYLSDFVDMICHCHNEYKIALRRECWLKLGDWLLAESSPTDGSIQENSQIKVLMAYKRAISLTNSDYKVWHSWALVNFRLAQQCNDDRSSVNLKFRLTSNFSATLRKHVLAAVNGFVQAICLGSKRWSASVQQDLLNLLACLFWYGENPEICSVIRAKVASIAPEAWLGVLPQLLARIHMRSSPIQTVIYPILIRLGEKHPQALMYPLSVLLKSPVKERKEAAESLMTSLRQHSQSLVEEALMVSSELIRLAILWLELWHEGLEDASRLYFGEGNVAGMLEVLIPLHEQFEKGPATMREQDFHKSFGRDLAEAYSFLKEYIRLTSQNSLDLQSDKRLADRVMSDENTQPPLSGRDNAEADAALNQAWDLYYTVFRRINKQLPGLTSLELSQSSPALLQAHSLELGVPGSYRVNGSYVKIEKFIPSVQVIASKQRPRKLTIRGGDGKDYVFLLKGHEDLRQDERVMQLFGLVNALFTRDRRTNFHDLSIQRYAITPLSHNVGLVGWVPHCDTFHSLIRDYREMKRIPLNMENREMLKLAPDYDVLTVMQKVEVFSEALDRTTGKGNDLGEVLWIKSTNSEEWLERRTKFTRSLGVMSIVGYVLGLGDRHPSNLMLDQMTGRVLHIDFGDCFEVAMHREKFPEKIPFRLTRMLQKAMEVSGVEGSYRSTCERTMSVLRENRDSLVAMLEAFVYDPLISFRLLGNNAKTNPRGSDSSSVLEDKLKKNNESGSLMDQNFFRSQRRNEREWMQDIIHEEHTDDDCEDEDHENEEYAIAPKEPTKILNKGKFSSRTKSMEMYLSIQNMAATANVSNHIANSISESKLDRSYKQREEFSLDMGTTNTETMNEKALKVIRRVQEKLTGTDFNIDGESGETLAVQDQVQRLIVQATSTENLCQLFIGWCAFW